MKTFKDKMENAIRRDGSNQWLVGLYMTQILVRVPRDGSNLRESFNWLKKLITAIIYRNCGSSPEDVRIHIRKGGEAGSFVISAFDGFSNSFPITLLNIRA